MIAYDKWCRPQSWDYIPALPVQIFERETNREKNLEKAMKEAKIKARKEAAKGGDAALDADLPPAELEKVGFRPGASTRWLMSGSYLSNHFITF